ncbi:WhiB family transcriptional regulator [Streptomyces sp. NPDC057675]|uniref:WhiB family transcriptional regulator n=1 Tax=Streptomyces sp. NPDC057675 TaxID=3346204 RepID=UPI003698196F
MTSSPTVNIPGSRTSELLCATADVDPEVFFPPPDAPRNWDRVAKRLCKACPSRISCLRTALEHGEKHGVWGGLNGKERSRFTERELPSEAVLRRTLGVRSAREIRPTS